MWSLLVVLLSSARAEEPVPEGPRVASTSGPIVVDGRLYEADWVRAEAVTDFRRYLPTAGGPPDGVTEVRFLQDERTLYIGVTVRGVSYPPRARMSPREDINDDDQIGIYLDTFGDGRTGYIFYFNAQGIQQDIRYANGSWFFQWDTVYLSEGEVTEDSYTIEIAIPFRSLRYPSVEEAGGEEQTWRLMVTRKLPHEGTKYAWPQLQRNHPRMFLQAGTLRGVKPASRGAGLWVQPVLALRHRMEDGGDGEGLRWTGLEPWQESLRPGLDLRLGLTPDLGAALTINPDFSQVEADVQIVDLNQRFAFYYPEQRPFFLDGVDAFSDQAGTLYTRSIASPLYGVKLSGQEGPLSIGFLHALDLLPSASVHEEGAPGFSAEDLSAEGVVASNSFARLRRDSFASGYLGLTMADRRVLGAGDDGGANDVIATDVSVPFGEVWTAEAYASASHTSDSVDSLSGLAGRGALVRSPEAGLGLSLSGYGRSPGFRQEMGFLNQSGLGGGYGSLGYTLGEGRSTWTPGVFGEVRSELDGDGFWEAGHQQGGVLAGIHQPSLSLSARRWSQGGVEVQGWQGSADWYAQLSRLLTLDVSASYGQELDFRLLVPARSLYLSGGGSVRPTRGTRLDLDLDQQWFTPEGEESVQATRIFTRLTWQFSRPLGLRLNQQSTFRSDSDPAHYTSLLLTWLETPGREVYLGATWSLDADLRPAEQTLFAKVSWLFQL